MVAFTLYVHIKVSIISRKQLSVWKPFHSIESLIIKSSFNIINHAWKHINFFYTNLLWNTSHLNSPFKLVKRNHNKTFNMKAFKRVIYKTFKKKNTYILLKSFSSPSRAEQLNNNSTLCFSSSSCKNNSTALQLLTYSKHISTYLMTKVLYL